MRQICYRWAQKKGTITLVDGPPGTGKSRLIINLLVQFHRGYIPNRPRKILLCAHSNAAVDLICRRLLRMVEHKKHTGGRGLWFLCGRVMRFFLFIVISLVAIPLLACTVNFKIVRFGVSESMHPSVRHVSMQHLAQRKIQLNDLQTEVRNTSASQ